MSEWGIDMKPKSRLTKLLSLALLSAILSILSVIATNLFSTRTAVTSGYSWEAILPAPPVANSANDQADLASVLAFQGQIATPRWEQAISDISFDVFDIYKPVLGPAFNAQSQPELQAVCPCQQTAQSCQP
jgi:hypothetical protein